MDGRTDISDLDLSYNQHISDITPALYLHIREIRKIRQSLDIKSAMLLSNTLVSSRLDICNSLFYGLPNSSIKRLQRGQNSLARVVILPSCENMIIFSQFFENFIGSYW